MRQKIVYDANGTSILQQYDYYASGLLHEATYANSAQNPGGDDLYYEYEDYDFYNNGSQGRIIVIRKSDGTYEDILSYHAGTDTVEEKEIFASDHTTWTRTYWFDASGFPREELSSTGEGKEYFGDGTWTTKTYWHPSNGTITGWDAGTYGDAQRPRWYYNGTTMEHYTYFASGRVQYKSIFTLGGTAGDGTTTWNHASTVYYLDSGGNPWGDWGDNYSGRPAAVPASFFVAGKPQRSASSSLDLGEELITDVTGDTILPERMERFYDDVEYLKESSSGEGIIVAVLDSGIETGVLSTNVIGGYDFTDTTTITFEDETGHGTSMAEAITDTAEDADILALKVVDEDGDTTSERVSDAIRYAVDAGARVLSMSFTLFPISDNLVSAIEYAVDQGAVLVAAAGNESSEILDASLAAQDRVITVGAVDADGTMSAWSNYGSEIDLFAPWDIINFEGDETGTSYSAAFVSGLAALVLEENPEYTASDVLGELELITADLGSFLEAAEAQEDPVEDAIGGVNIDEVIARYEAERKSRALFRGESMHKPKRRMDILEKQKLGFKLKGPR